MIFSKLKPLRITLYTGAMPEEKKERKTIERELNAKLEQIHKAHDLTRVYPSNWGNSPHDILYLAIMYPALDWGKIQKKWGEQIQKERK